jgi:hypothetical protein
MLDHFLPKLHGMTHELNSSVISTILNIFFLFLKIGTDIFFLYSSSILLDRKMILNSLVSHAIVTFQDIFIPQLGCHQVLMPHLFLSFLKLISH